MEKIIQSKAAQIGLKNSVFENEEFRIEYWAIDNDKPPLVLLHAFAASGLYSWRPQLVSLSKHFRLIIPNLLYFGKSTSFNQKYHINDQTDAISQFLRHLNVESFYLGGASYGGSVAYAIAQQRNFDVKKLFLTNAPLIQLGDAEWSDVLAEFNVDSKSEILVPNDYRQLYKLYLKSRYYPSIIHPIVFKSVYKNLYEPNKYNRRLLVNSYVDYAKQKELEISKLNISISLLWGTNDSLVPVFNAIELQKKLGKTTVLKTFTRTGHMPNLEKSRQYNKELLRFLLEE